MVLTSYREEESDWTPLFLLDMRRKKSLTFHYNIKIAPSQEDRSGRADKSARFSVVFSIDKSRKVWYNERGNININI